MVSPDVGDRNDDDAQDDARSVSSPEDVGGRGPVTLSDRTRHGGQGSPDTNQAKTEPMPSTPGDPDPNAELEPPSLAQMNVGGADPQSPSHPAARPRDVPTGAAPAGRLEEAAGVTPSGEQPGIDVAAGAAAMQPDATSTAAPTRSGDAQDVPVPHEASAPGTSQESSIVHGARTALPPDA